MRLANETVNRFSTGFYLFFQPVQLTDPLVIDTKIFDARYHHALDIQCAREVHLFQVCPELLTIQAKRENVVLLF